MTRNPQIFIKTFDELTAFELHHIYLTRGLVFTVGQQITEQDIDDVDLRCVHLYAPDTDGRVLGYLRMFDLGKISDSSHSITEGSWTIGRVAVLDSARGTGLGRKILDTAVSWIKENTDAQRIDLTAQSYLKDTLYKDFTVHGAEFMDAGLPHYHMSLELDR